MSNTIESKYTSGYNRDKTCSCPDQCSKTWVYWNPHLGWTYDDTLKVKCSKYSTIINTPNIQIFNEDNIDDIINEFNSAKNYFALR